jgi:hypothetical protein
MVPNKLKSRGKGAKVPDIDNDGWVSKILVGLYWCILA